MFVRVSERERERGGGGGRTTGWPD